MNELTITIVGGIVVAILVAIFGIGNTTHVVVHGGGKVLRSGKWIMTFSAILFFVGLSFAQKATSPGGIVITITEEGSVLAMCSVFFFFIGKFTAWIQK